MDFRESARAAVARARAGEPRKAVMDANALARAAGDAGDAAAQAYCRAAEAHCLLCASEFSRAERAARDALSAAQSVGDAAALALAQAVLSIVINRANIGEAALLALRAERLSDRLADTHVRHMALMALSDLFSRVEAAEEARAYSRDVLALVRESGDPMQLATASSAYAVDTASIAIQALASGSAHATALAAEAEAALAEALLVTTGHGAGYSKALVLLNQGLLAEARGRWADALVVADVAKETGAACLARNIVGRATALRSRVLVKQGRAAEATDAASEALSIGITADHNEVKSVAILALADASEATGDYEGAARALRRALELTRVQRDVPRHLLVQMRDALSDEARVRSELSHRRSEVTQLREAAAELARRTEALIEAGHRDTVTGLASRARADEWLPQLMDAAKFAHQAMAVALIDIDHLKAINDSFGPTVGDRVLQRVADLTRGQLRESDFAARYGSDEIVLFLPRVGGRDPAVQVAERVVAAVGRADWRDLSAELRVGVNVGVALLVSQDSPESLRARAEQALISSRKGGVNKVEFAAAPDL